MAQSRKVLADEAFEAEESNDPNMVALLRLRNIVRRCMLYSHDMADQIRADSQLVKLKPDTFSHAEELVSAEMREQFFLRFFVDRDAVTKLSNAVRASNVSLLEGPRGCGKTTVVLRVVSILKSENGQLGSFLESPDCVTTFHYLNLKAHVPQKTGSQTEPVATVCSRLFDLVRSYYLPTDNAGYRIESAVTRGWQQFVECSAPEFNAVRELRSNGLPLPDGLLESAYLEFGRRSGEDKLPLFLEFLNSFGHRVVVFVDNCDRHDLDLQEELFRKAIRLSESPNSALVTALALRDSTIRKLKASENTDTSVPSVVLDSDRRTTISATGKMLHDVMQKRFAFLMDFSKQEHSTLLDAFAASLKPYNMNGVSDYLGHCANALSSVKHQLSNIDLCEEFLTWHDGSIRSAAAHIDKVIALSVTREDPFFVNEVGELPVSQHERLRRVRTHVFRHLIFGDASFPDTPMTPNLLSVAPGRMVRYRMLRLIGQAGYGGIDYRAYLDLAMRLGCSPNAAFAALETFRNGCGFEGEGFVTVDVRPTQFKLDMSGEIRVMIRPSGEHLLNVLCTKVEYIFWMAMFTRHRVHSDFAVIRERRPIADVKIDSLRVQIATNFLYRYVTPLILAHYLVDQSGVGGPDKVEQAKVIWRADPRDRPEAIAAATFDDNLYGNECDILGKDGTPLSYIQRSLRNLAQFMSTSDSELLRNSKDAETVAALMQLLAEIEQEKFRLAP